MIGRIQTRFRALSTSSVDSNDIRHTDRSSLRDSRHRHRGGNTDRQDRINTPRSQSRSPPRFADSSSSLQSPSDRERDALESQIRKRDHFIASLERDLVVLAEMSTDLRSERDEIRRSLLESLIRHTAAVGLWKRTNDGLRTRVECFRRESSPEAAAEIAALIRDAAPANKDSAYLITLQEQLGKATLKIENLANHTDAAAQYGSEVIQSLRTEMEEVIIERVKIEIEMRDQVEELLKEKKASKKRYKREISKVAGEISFLERRAVEEMMNDSDEGGEVGDGDGEDKDGEKEEENMETQKTAEELRRELRHLSMEGERSIAFLRSKLRDKDKELTSLKRLKESSNTPMVGEQTS